MSSRQLHLFTPGPLRHGGGPTQGKRKARRPLDPSRPVHVVLRSTRARGTWSLLHRRNRVAVKDTVLRAGRASGVRVMNYVNVGNHLHLLVKTPSRPAFQRFLRTASGRVAQLVTGAVKGRPAPGASPSGRKFWDFLAYSRVVAWGRDHANTVSYLVKNLAEALGLPDPRTSDGRAALFIPRRAGPPLEEVWG